MAEATINTQQKQSRTKRQATTDMDGKETKASRQNVQLLQPAHCAGQEHSAEEMHPLQAHALRLEGDIQRMRILVSETETQNTRLREQLEEVRREAEEKGKDAQIGHRLAATNEIRLKLSGLCEDEDSEKILDKLLKATSEAETRLRGKTLECEGLKVAAEETASLKERVTQLEAENSQLSAARKVCDDPPKTSCPAKKPA